MSVGGVTGGGKNIWSNAAWPADRRGTGGVRAVLGGGWKRSPKASAETSAWSRARRAKFRPQVEMREKPDEDVGKGSIGG